ALSLPLPQRNLSALALLDVVGGTVPSYDLTVLVAHSDAIDGEPAILPVEAPDALFRMQRLPLGESLTPHRLNGRDLVWIDYDRPFRAESCLVGKACVLFPGGVDEVASGIPRNRVNRISPHRDLDGV